MRKLIAAHTNFDTSYPGYINFTREDDGTVTVLVRANPETVEDSYVCGYARDKGQPGRCTPGDDRCNNYCNLAPDKGPMQKHPASCSHVREGASARVTLSADDFKRFIADVANAS